jgi:type II pantothenate kinase
LKRSDLAVFPLLAEPLSYVASEWDLADNVRRAYWVGLFRGHFVKLLDEAQRDAATRGEPAASALERANRARADFGAYLDRIEAGPFHDGRPDVLALCSAREAALRRCGFADPYRTVKARENERALELFADVVGALDLLDERARGVRLVEGIFAGNLFDLGATETVARFEGGQAVDFLATRDELRPRPWRVDDLSSWLDRLSGKPHRAAALFVDNAGPDLVLGMVPFARELLRRGTRVILTANSDPALNDITHVELVALLDRLRKLDPFIDRALDAGTLETIASGNGTPLIDLTHVSGQLVDAVQARGVDLVVLEGMGRAIESNYSAKLSCDAIKVAMLKDPDVAAFVGGTVYDLVFRFESSRGRPL